MIYPDIDLAKGFRAKYNNGFFSAVGIIPIPEHREENRTARSGAFPGLLKFECVEIESEKCRDRSRD